MSCPALVERLVRASLVVGMFGTAVTTSACGVDADVVETEDDDGELDDEIDESSAEIAVAGRWSPPASVIAAGTAAQHGYEPARGACAGGLLPGSRVLGDEIERRFAGNIASLGRGLPAVQGYNCRSVRGGSGLSVHATGRALDIFVPRSRGAADNTKGDAIANWLVQNARDLGVQAVIWDRAAWSVKTKRIAGYRGQHPHDDHVHVELVSDAASKRLAWYRAR